MTEKKKEETKPNIEDSLAAVEEILDQMEEEGTGLEDSFRLYAEGMRYLQAATNGIDEIEKQLRILAGEDEDDGFEEDDLYEDAPADGDAVTAGSKDAGEAGAAGKDA